MKNKFTAVVLLFTLMFQTVYADTDSRILTDPVTNVYEGIQRGTELIKTANFSDVAADYWAKEPITRVAALGIIKGSGGANGNYWPESPVSKEEALTLIVRFLDMDERARAAGGQRAEDDYEDSTMDTGNYWSLGYLQVASEIGLITAENVTDAAEPDQSILDPAYAFLRQSPATREEVAEWVAKALIMQSPEGYRLPTQYTNVRNFNDWRQIDILKIPYVESVLVNNIMNGVSASQFNPKGSITRAQMAQVLKNIDEIYLRAINHEKKIGTIAAVTEQNSSTTGASGIVRSLHIRVSDGTRDDIKLVINANTMGQTVNDAVVLNGGVVTGLSSLQEGDEIEYIVDNANIAANASIPVIYVHKRSGFTETQVTGNLVSVDPVRNEITLGNTAGGTQTYTLAQGLIRTENQVSTLALLDMLPQNINSLATGSKFELNLVNGIVRTIRFLGEPVLTNEIGGVVLENNPDLGYITLFAHDGTITTKQYYETDMFVKKVQYYDNSDQIGYIAQMFPLFKFNPADTTIDNIEPGDVVFLLLDPNDSNIVIGTSASTNYVARYGKVLNIEKGAEINRILLEGENKQTGWYDVPSHIPVTKEGRITTFSELQPGDWARVLVNQAIMEPGYYIESVKEVVIEGEQRFITTIAKGQLGSMDEVQRLAAILNYQELTRNGWSNHQDVERIDISGADTEIYLDGQRITLDYAFRYLKRGGAEAYMAIEDNYGGGRIKKITFRTGRDDVLQPDTVVNTHGDGSFNLSSRIAGLSSDDGTIVVRNGRLVTGNSIMTPDYANVVVNGENRAAIVSIAEGAGATAPIVIRGRVSSVDSGKTFTVASFASLSGNLWTATPIQRVFTIDYNTKFYGEDGFRNINTLVDYGENTSRNIAYTVVTDGSRADWIFDMPYTDYAIRGTVVETGEGSVTLKGLTVYNAQTGAWRPQNSNFTATVSRVENGAVIKSNSVVEMNDVQIGNQIMVMTTTLPTVLTGSVEVPGHLVFVEN